MPAVQSRLDFSSISVGGSDQKQFVQSGTATFTNYTFEGRSVVDRHNRPIKESKDVKVVMAMYADVSTNVRAGMKDISAFTLGGNSFAGYISSLSISKSFQHKNAQGAGTEWRFPVYDGEDTTSSCTLMIPVAEYPAFVKGLDASGQAAANLAVSVTINGVTWSFPAMAETVVQGIPESGWQPLDVQLLGTGVATSPSGTASLLAAALNAPETPLALSLISNATNGSTWAGDALIESVSFSVSEGSPAITSFTYASQDDWSIT